MMNPPRCLVTGGEADPFLPQLCREICRATQIDWAVSFIKSKGLELLLPELEEAVKVRRVRLRVLTSTYLDVTDPQALRYLLLLSDHGAQIRLYSNGSQSFHLKSYLFLQSHEEQLQRGCAFVGSSNITSAALTNGLEWNYRLIFPDRSDSSAKARFFEIREQFEHLFGANTTLALTHEQIEQYERSRRVTPLRVAPGSDEPEPEAATPIGVQNDALRALEASRSLGFRRGLVVMATGLGKTYLAAFDARQLHARRILFVAHREEILLQAEKTFLNIWPRARVGHFTGDRKTTEAELLFASVQTLGKHHHLEQFAKDHFDYVIVDEFHHAAAATYRQLLAHFEPQFLLGLTATPERTDQSDILSLCDDNLVFTCNLFDGVRQQLLCPFTYHGIFDEAVDYREIPWRNGQFDPETLSNKLATLARARHAHREWRARCQQRTLAFCVSIQHAEFMAAKFKEWKVAAEAVHNQSTLRRSEALKQLETGKLEIIFSVDLFNEGVDLPSIDTIIMLRPTESKVLFLQQLGRGLRRHVQKERLVVMDFIGNHKGFLNKPTALFDIGSTASELAKFAEQAEEGALDLPAGCFVNYDLQIINFLKHLSNQGIQHDYEALKAALGRRPTLLELQRSGVSVIRTRQQYGSWWGLVQEMGDLTTAEQVCVTRHTEWLREVEITATTKSFKMILLQVLLDRKGFIQPLTAEALSHECLKLFQRKRTFIRDLKPEYQDIDHIAAGPWHRYWLSNPINAWLGGNRNKRGRTWFKLENGRFEPTFQVTEAEYETFTALTQEIVDFRLAQYTSRELQDIDQISTKESRQKGTELAFFPDLKIACGHFKPGSSENSDFRKLSEGYGNLDPARHCIALASGHSMNGGKHPIRDGDHLLLEFISPEKAGTISGATVAIQRQNESGDNEYLLRDVYKAGDGSYILKAKNLDFADLPVDDSMRPIARLKNVIKPIDLALGQLFMREEIPPLFGHEFNPGNWNSGHITLRDSHTQILLVTLNKQGKSKDHRYLDHFIDETHFHWQSQKSVDASSKKGREIIAHEAQGMDVYLFVRNSKLMNGKAAPFHCHGKVRYVSHKGGKPMSVVWELLEGQFLQQ